EAVGEEDARADGRRDGVEGTDGAHYRSVIVSAELPLSLGVPQFVRPDPFNRIDGFDDRPTPPWAMVPLLGGALAFLGGSRQVRLLSGVGLTVVSDNNAVCEVLNLGAPGRPVLVTDPFQAIDLVGIRTGTAQIRAIDPCGRIVARLDVGVKNELSFR